MTKDELIIHLKECGKDYDYEQAHIIADYFLIKYINDENITKVWKKISKGFRYA